MHLVCIAHAVSLVVAGWTGLLAAAVTMGRAHALGSKKVIAVTAFERFGLRLGPDTFLALAVEHVLQEHAAGAE